MDQIQMTSEQQKQNEHMKMEQPKSILHAANADNIPKSNKTLLKLSSCVNKYIMKYSISFITILKEVKIG